MNKLVLITILLFFALNPAKVIAADDVFYKAVAGFVRGFPDMVRDAPGKLCVYGYDQVAVEIEEKYQDTVLLKNEASFNAGFSKERCKVLYVSKKAPPQVIATANAAKIVSIGVDDYFIENSGMVFVEMGRRNFELTVNHKNLRGFGVKLDPLAAGLIVN